MKKVIVSIVILALLPLLTGLYGQSLNKTRKSIVGSWKFDKYVKLSSINETKAGYDTAFMFRAYTFKPDGKVTVWALDKNVFDFNDQNLTYGVYSKNINGKNYTVFKIVTNDCDPFDYTKIDNSAGILNIVIYSSDKEMRLIKYQKGSTIYPDDWLSQYVKIPDPSN